jgi:hypothetical protein
MTDEKRKIVAFVAGILISRPTVPPRSIYDYTLTKYFDVSWEMVDDKINVYDYDRGCHVTGNLNGQEYSLYDYGDSAYTNLKINEPDKFEGYDYGTSSYFNGTVNGNAISLYDYQTAMYHEYQI